jgi:hypothetical protein
MTNATKIFKTRDSATSALRKLGIASSDYVLYIEKHKDGFECFIGDAEEALGIKPSTQPEAKAPKKTKTSEATTETKPLSIAGHPETSTFEERVSAHDQLESFGVKPEHTTQFIEKTKKGFMSLNHKAIEWVLAGHKKTPYKPRTDLQVSIAKATAAELARAPKEVFKSQVEKAATDKKRGVQPRTLEGASMSAFMRRLILAGKTNEEVLAAAVVQFRLSKDDASKRAGYPAWYRHDCLRKGLIEA